MLIVFLTGLGIGNSNHGQSNAQTGARRARTKGRARTHTHAHAFSSDALSTIDPGRRGECQAVQNWSKLVEF